MKLIFAFLFLLSSSLFFGQYEYFNITQFGTNGGTFQTTVFNGESGHISLGLGGGAGLEFRRTNYEGITVENNEVEMYPHAIIAVGNFADGFIKSPQGFISRYDFLMSGCSVTTQIMGLIHLDENMNSLWEQEFSEWSICDTLNYECTSFCPVDDTSFAALSSFTYMNGQPFHPDSSGWRITRMKYSTGEVLEDHAMVQPNHIYSMRQIRYVAGNYFILGYAVPFQGTTQNPGDEQTLLYKVSPNGDILGQVELGNPNHCYERYPQMEVTNDDKLLIFYDYCIDMYPILFLKVGLSTFRRAMFN
jgi:hypothetical protein